MARGPWLRAWAQRSMAGSEKARKVKKELEEDTAWESGFQAHEAGLGRLAVVLVAQWYRICLQCPRHKFDPWVTKILWRKKRPPTQYSGLWTEEPGGLQLMGLQSQARLSD